MRLTRSKFDVHNLFLTFDFFVHICFLDQIFSLCYLFSEHASDKSNDFFEIKKSIFFQNKMKKNETSITYLHEYFIVFNF